MDLPEGITMVGVDAIDAAVRKNIKMGSPPRLARAKAGDVKAWVEGTLKRDPSPSPNVQAEGN